MFTLLSLGAKLQRPNCSCAKFFHRLLFCELVEAPSIKKKRQSELRYTDRQRSQLSEGP